MSWVLRCMEGSCSWGITTPDMSSACECAKSHMGENKGHIVVSRDSRWEFLHLHDSEGVHPLAYDKEV